MLRLPTAPRWVSTNPTQARWGARWDRRSTARLFRVPWEAAVLKKSTSVCGARIAHSTEPPPPPPRVALPQWSTADNPLSQCNRCRVARTGCGEVVGRARVVLRGWTTWTPWLCSPLGLQTSCAPTCPTHRPTPPPQTPPSAATGCASVARALPRARPLRNSNAVASSSHRRRTGTEGRIRVGLAALGQDYRECSRSMVCQVG
mmetsp:Transcript_13050/g.30808  ORF Transcript_13050/g.30808 Transcript_13050/m.30808 type:complete len:203 (+) Transcript_13050:1285-1893(+)